MQHNEQFNLVITGHVDHGKSTVIGRLLADTNSLPQGKLDAVRAYCEKNAKTFEYAFLLDALKEEQSQGITIDAARIFFKTAKRNYLIIDAPGHIEFLKNMISGAAHAEGGVIVIDAKEGIRENSKRHGYLISMLGIRQVSVLINKMDAVDYSEDAYNAITAEYAAFLGKIGVQPLRFIPVAARNGENISARSENMDWYNGPTLLEQIDQYESEQGKDEKTFRFPVQDVYKFTDSEDDRRILAGMVVSGSVSAGDAVRFFPSNKRSVIRSVENFNGNNHSRASAGFSTGFTLEDPLYIKPGEIMVKSGEEMPPKVSRRFAVNLFWMGNFPMVRGKQYAAKLGSARILVKLSSIRHIVDAAELSCTTAHDQIERFDVAECVLEASKPAAFDLVPDFETTARFVIIDNFEIAGAGIILNAEEDNTLSMSEEISLREKNWDRSEVTDLMREERYRHRPKFILLAGINVERTGKILEKKLFERNYHAYYLGLKSILAGLDRDLSDSLQDRDEEVRRLGELAKIFTDAGLMFISAVDGLDDYDIDRLKTLNTPNDIIVINKGNQSIEKYPSDLDITSIREDENAVTAIISLLRQREILLEYYI